MNNLYRSRQNKMIAGVAGGMAEFTNLDVTLVRLVWVLAFLAGGAGFLAYIICWIIIPESTGEYMQNNENNYNDVGQLTVSPSQRTARRRNAGLVLIALGSLFLIKNFLPWYYWNKGWPLLLVAVGLYILLANKKGDPA